VIAMADRSAYVQVNRRPLGGHERLLALAGRPARALDIGCSSGYLARRLVDRGAEVVGVEADAEAAALAKTVCSQVVVGDVESIELPFEKGSFDVVLCGDVIEHLRDPRAMLARVRPLIAPGGRLVLTTPNVANWTLRLGLLFGRWRYTDRGLLDRTHTHLFTRDTLTETLQRAGYGIVTLDYTVPVPIIGTPSIERAAHAIARARPSLFAYQFVVAAAPR
jgi:2-polyprenyl-3-methyl-5-hydroxy-6-metoxy-1,4-benzoquinol methylase